MTTPQPRLPVIPKYITVHLGRPDANAPNTQVPFTDYIKNVASSEIYPTWPEAAIRANIYAQITFALNRIYTEWYRSKGYNFDITNSTQFDQAYNPGRDVFENISGVVDEIFNDYVVQQGSVEPYFTQFCNGTTVTCDGLSQWGTVSLANQGYTPYEMLQRYYGSDINIIRNAPVQNIEESYSGIPMRLGSSGNDVLTIQQELNRIRLNFPAIPKIQTLSTVYDLQTQAAVSKFQQVFNLPQTGVVEKGTWYKIKDVYNSVKHLGELTSEGLMLSEITPAYPDILEPGTVGNAVSTLQYYLGVIGYFNPALPIVDITGSYDTQTQEAVRAFQRLYGIPTTGNVYRATWEKILDVYSGIVSSLSAEFYGARARIYPGTVLSQGMRGDDVSSLQRYLSGVSRAYPEVPAVPETGYYGEQTENAVRAFQRMAGLAESGRANALTWSRLAEIYDSLL